MLHPSEITASFSDIMRQGPMKMSLYLQAGIGYIDDELGEGFAKKTPTLLSAFILGAAIDVAVGILAQQTRIGLEHEAYNGVTEVAEAIREGLTEVSASLDVVAEQSGNRIQ